MMIREISEEVGWQPFLGDADDAHGNQARTWGPSVQRGIWAFDPGSSSEPRPTSDGAVGGSRVIVEPTVYMPASVVFGPYDRVTVRGEVYEVEGETRQWRHPSKKFTGNVATLRRVDG